MPHKYLWRKTKNFFIYRVLHVDDTPHRIALAAAIGIFWAFLPCIGLQMIGTFVTSWLLRANKVVGLPFCWVSNYATLWIYLPNYWLGALLLPKDYSLWALWDRLRQIRDRIFDASFFQAAHTTWQMLKEFLAPLWVGSVIIAPILAAGTYFLIRWAVVKYREHRLAKLRRENDDSPGNATLANPTE